MCRMGDSEIDDVSILRERVDTLNKALQSLTDLFNTTMVRKERLEGELEQVKREFRTTMVDKKRLVRELEEVQRERDYLYALAEQLRSYIDIVEEVPTEDLGVLERELGEPQREDDEDNTVLPPDDDEDNTYDFAGSSAKMPSQLLRL